MGQGGHLVDIDGLTAAGLFFGGLLAGALNAVAGGSSFITFPLLLAAGLPPLVANTTNFVALTPANAVALIAYRAEVARIRELIDAEGWGTARTEATFTEPGEHVTPPLAVPAQLIALLPRLLSDATGAPVSACRTPRRVPAVAA